MTNEFEIFVSNIRNEIEFESSNPKSRYQTKEQNYVDIFMTKYHHHNKGIDTCLIDKIAPNVGFLGYCITETELVLYYTRFSSDSYQVENNSLYDSQVKFDFRELVSIATDKDKKYLNKYDRDTDEYELLEYLDENQKKNLTVKINIVSNEFFTNKHIDDRFIEEGYYSIEINHYGIDKLFELHKEISENGDNTLIDIQKYNSDLKAYLVSNSNNVKTYLLAIDGFTLASIYNEYREAILESNVRLFLKNTKVNKGIASTIQKEPGMFLSYNNGISATASDMTFENVAGENILRIKTLENLQIVNGGQTTASLKTEFLKSSNRIKFKNILVSMKLNIVESMSDENRERIVEDISKFTNTQNTVPRSAFLATHNYFRKIEELSHNERIRKNGFDKLFFFERMKGQKNIFIDKIGKESFASRYEFDYNIANIAHVVLLEKLKINDAAYGKETYIDSAMKIIDKYNIDNIGSENYRDIISSMMLFRYIDYVIKLEKTEGMAKSKYGSIHSVIMTYTYPLIRKYLNEKGILNIDIWNNNGLDALLLPHNVVQETAKKVYDYFMKFNTEHVQMEARKPTFKNKFVNEFDLT